MDKLNPAVFRTSEGDFVFIAVDDYMAATKQIEQLRAAALRVIEFNRQQAEDQYGDREKAEAWACVKVLREALAE